MKVLDKGHIYQLDIYNGTGEQILAFMKREGKGYPGNKGHFAGTNCQEVLRALIDRVKYMDGTIKDFRNPLILENLRAALYGFEDRAAQRHERKNIIDDLTIIEMLPTCPVCGHIGCIGNHKAHLIVEES